MFGEKFQLKVHKNDMRNVSKCLPFVQAFIENGMQIKKSHSKEIFLH